MTVQVATVDCRHRVISAEPDAQIGICLECRAQLDLDVLEALWRAEEPEGLQDDAE